jgi:predicted ArsR family transcriptional regulator
LYYHLSELKKAGVIEVAGYKDEGGGAPEKVWRLKSRRIVIDLLEGVDGRDRS